MDAPDPPGGTASGQPPDPLTPAPAAGATGGAEPERPPHPSIWQSEGAKVAVIGAVATALAAAIFTSSRIDAIVGWFPGSSSATSATPSSTSPATAYKTVTGGDRAITLSVPADWGVGDAHYNLPVAGVIDAGSGLRSGKGSGMVSAASYDEPSAFIGGSVDAAKRLQLAGRSAQDHAKYIKQLLQSDDYTIDGCSYAGQQTLDKPGFVAIADTWTSCNGFPDTEFRNMYAIGGDGSILVVGQVVTVGAERASGEKILGSFAIRPGSVMSGRPESTPDKRHPVPDWVAARSGDLIIP